MSKFWPKGGVTGTLHHYTETLVTFEYTNGTAPKPHSILFVGGLSDGLATTSYTADIVAALAPTKWSLFTLNLSSSYNSWGSGHLDRDTDEIATCLSYIQAYKHNTTNSSTCKLAIMGHSTGSQAILHYIHRPNPHPSLSPFDPDLQHVIRPLVDGAIMQAPVSDREAILSVCEEGMGDKSPSDIRAAYDKLLLLARDGVRENTLDTFLPMSLTAQFGFGETTPISCRRWLSLASPDSPSSPSQDDLFSSDLSDEQLSRTFGMIRQRGLLRQRLLVLISGADQAMPEWIDKRKLLARWERATNHDGKAKIWDDGSCLIPNASHGLSNDDQGEPRRFLASKVLSFLESLEIDDSSVGCCQVA
ncbi:DUF1749-domain-containing protein [Xylariaceae sp. FL1019]|nr:DUF1749-domain-containing protein [Xylariaceae sp. FL1019]